MFQVSLESVCSDGHQLVPSDQWLPEGWCVWGPTVLVLTYYLPNELTSEGGSVHTSPLFQHVFNFLLGVHEHINLAKEV